MVKIYFGEDSEAVYGYKLSEIDTILWTNKICDLGFNLVEYLRKKKVLNKSGKVISDKYGMMNMEEKTIEGLYEETTQKYIFVPIDGARELIGELFIKSKGKAR